LGDSKREGRHLFAPDLGGNNEVFNERPLEEEIRIYCEQDVSCLPNLHEFYQNKLRFTLAGGVEWEKKIDGETERDCKTP
jgi:hypothetical protein